MRVSSHLPRQGSPPSVFVGGTLFCEGGACGREGGGRVVQTWFSGASAPPQCFRIASPAAARPPPCPHRGTSLLFVLQADALDGAVDFLARIKGLRKPPPREGLQGGVLMHMLETGAGGTEVEEVRLGADTGPCCSFLLWQVLGSSASRPFRSRVAPPAASSYSGWLSCRGLTVLSLLEQEGTDETSSGLEVTPGHTQPSQQAGHLPGSCFAAAGLKSGPSPSLGRQMVVQVLPKCV